MANNDITPLSPGALAPDFTLPDVLSGLEVTLGTLRGQVVVLNFWSCECPWSRRYDEYFSKRASDWEEEGIRLLHVKSNFNESLDAVERQAVKSRVDAPILDDAEGRVADRFGARTTPHVFVIDEDGRIAYQGAIDDRDFRNDKATVNYLDKALDAVRAHQQPEPAETPAYGCAIVREYVERA